jgi:ribosomal protein L37AE/L43A
VEEILELEVYNSNGNITNIIPTQRVFNGAPCFFYLETMLEDGEIKTSLTHTRAIPVQTAPSLDFYKCNYNSLKDIYTELRKIICDYIAFPTDSIAPDLIALGSVASYFREIYYTYPYFDFISSEPEAGKTTAMKVQTFTSFYGTIASSVTEALLFREIDGSHCFYGLDNIERLFASPKDYASIIDWLLSSYSRDIPCKRLEKTEEGYEVRYFDGYGIKAFTHIRDFPYALRALRSRCIQIVMQNAKPAKFYPSAGKFTEIRDNLYKARLFEFESVKESYEKLIDSNVLAGRTGDLYFPLLSIAKLIDNDLFTRVLHYAKSEEIERKEYDGWNVALISVLLEYELYGTHSTKEIGKVYEEALREKGLLKEGKSFYTRTVTMRLKKLGFQREEKKTENKTWFLIDEKNAMSKAYAYGILDGDKLEENTNPHTPPKPNFPNLLNFGEDQDKPKEGNTEGSGENKPGTEKIYLDSNGSNEELAKLAKLAKRGVCESTKNVCDGCGMNAQTTEYNGEWLCDKCLTDYADNLKGNVGIRPEAFDEDFQIKQDKEAADRLRAEK